MQVCGKLASFAQGSRGLWKTQKVNTVYRNLTQNSRGFNINLDLTFLTRTLQLTKNLPELNISLTYTILTQNLQDLNTENRTGGTRSVPPAEKSPRARHSRRASCKLRAGRRAGQAASWIWMLHIQNNLLHSRSARGIM